MIDLHEILGGLGLLLIAVGCYLVYPPAALLVPGSLLFMLAVGPYVLRPGKGD